MWRRKPLRLRWRKWRWFGEGGRRFCVWLGFDKQGLTLLPWERCTVPRIPCTRLCVGPRHWTRSELLIGTSAFLTLTLSPAQDFLKVKIFREKGCLSVETCKVVNGFVEKKKTDQIELVANIHCEVKHFGVFWHVAGIAQLGERQTEDLKVACSIHAHRNRLMLFFFCYSWISFLNFSVPHRKLKENCKSL